MRRVIVKIDSLVLKGFSPRDRLAIARGLQSQLTEMFSAPDVAQRLSKMENVSGLRLQMPSVGPGERAERVGSAAASRIGKGLGL